MIGSAFPPSYYLALGAICGAAGFRLGWRWKNRFVLPLTQAIFGWVAFATGWQAHGPAWAAAVVGAWALGSTLVSLITFTGAPVDVDRAVLRARSYRESMLDWLRTGKGPEARPLSTAWSHARELALYVVAAIATANFLSIALGAVLLNYMNAYVATLLRAARRKRIVAALAWNVWSVVRVAAYVVLGAAAAEVLGRFVGLPPAEEQVRALWLWGGAASSSISSSNSFSRDRAVARSRRRSIWSRRSVGRAPRRPPSGWGSRIPGRGGSCGRSSNPPSSTRRPATPASGSTSWTRGDRCSSTAGT